MAEKYKGDNPLVKHYSGKINIIAAIYHSGIVNVELYIIYSIAYILVHLRAIIYVYTYFMVGEEFCISLRTK